VKAIDLLNIPEVLKSCTLDKVKECPHKQLVSNYIKRLPELLKTRQGLYLWGEYGQGKSALAAIILMEAIKYDAIGFWVSAKQLPGYVINHTEWMDNISYYDRAVMVPLLVIDEFQTRQEVKFQESCVEDLIRVRVSMNKPTIITSNIVPAVLKSIYPAFHSVLQECFASEHVQGYDWRAANGGLVIPDLYSASVCTK